MRHTPGTTAPRPAAARGLGAVVLLALLALLHATFSPGPSHLTALDLDGCRLRAAATSAHLCETAPPVVVTAAGAEGHPTACGSNSEDVARRVLRDAGGDQIVLQRMDFY